MTPQAQAAADTAAAGWPVHPLRPGEKRPLSAHGVKDATTDPAIIRQHWSAHPRANIGIALPPDVVALDIDVKGGVNGFDSLAALERAHGPLPATRKVKTPSGGQHLYFSKPAGRRIKNTVGVRPGLDVRTHGGYLVGPGSVIDGRGYELLADCKPAPAPAWLLDLLAPPAPSRDTYADKAMERAHTAVANAPEGQRNEELNGAAFGLARIAAADRLDWHRAAAQLEQAALAAGLQPAEIRATLESARAAGERDPNFEGLPGQVDPDTGELTPALVPVSVIDVLSHPSEPPRYIWDEYCPRGVVTLFGAHGGTGKSTIALMLAVAVASGRGELFGVGAQTAPVVFASLEDGAHIVRHRLAKICQQWDINPADLDKLRIVDGTENPELYSCEGRGTGGVTSAYHELRGLAAGAGLVVVDNASDAYGGDEIQRRQVRAFIRALAAVAKDNDAAVLLLAHVDKGTSRRDRSDSEGYSGSTAWHNSVRSRLFMSRQADGGLLIEHQKNNLGPMREPLALEWPQDALPQAVQAPSPVTQSIADRVDTKALLALIAEFAHRGEYVTTATTSRTHAAKLLSQEATYPKGRKPAEIFDLLRKAERAGYVKRQTYQGADRKPRERWEVTPEGQAFSGFAATAATSRHYQVTAPTAKEACGDCGDCGDSLGGTGELARTNVAAAVTAPTPPNGPNSGVSDAPKTGPNDEVAATP